MLRFLIYLLLACPFDTPVPRFLQPKLLETLKQVNAELELAAPTERYGEFPGELRWARDQYHWLHDAPPLADCLWTPLGYAEWTDFANEYRENLLAEQEFSPHRYWQYQDAIDDLSWCRRVYELGQAAREESSGLACRRRALMDLRDMIGCEAYGKGRWPGPIPLHRFRSLDD